MMIAYPGNELVTGSILSTLMVGYVYSILLGSQGFIKQAYLQFRWWQFYMQYTVLLMFMTTALYYMHMIGVFSHHSNKVHVHINVMYVPQAYDDLCIILYAYTRVLTTNVKKVCPAGAVQAPAWANKSFLPQHTATPKISIKFCVGSFRLIFKLQIESSLN